MKKEKSMDDSPIKINDLLKVISVSVSRIIIVERPNGERCQGEYMSPANIALVENDFLVVKRVYSTNGSASCERVTPGISGSAVFALLNMRIISS
jgi:hypothetical protein